MSKAVLPILRQHNTFNMYLKAYFIKGVGRIMSRFVLMVRFNEDSILSQYAGIIILKQGRMLIYRFVYIEKNPLQMGYDFFFENGGL